MWLSTERRSKTAELTLLLVSRFAFAFASALTAVATVACGSGTAPEAAAKKNLQSEYNESGRLTRLTYDRNGDGKIDTWGYMDGARVIRIEVDENGDGKIDRWEYHTDSKGSEGSGGATPSMASNGDAVDVTLERIERATKFDGKISRREFFERGVLTRIEEDTDGDGKIDKWETYSAGTLAIMAIDTKARGTPDRRLIYQSDGTLNRIETDPSGNGAWHPLPQ